MTLYLELDTNPTGTAQQKGERVVGKHIHHFTKKKVKTQRAIYIQKITEALEDLEREAPNYEGPVFLNVMFYYSIKDKKRWGYWKTSKPDNDNAVKLLQDVLCELNFFKDDSQVADLHVKKKLSEHPGILIDIGRLIQP